MGDPFSFKENANFLPTQKSKVFPQHYSRIENEIILTQNSQTPT